MDNKLTKRLENAALRARKSHHDMINNEWMTGTLDAFALITHAINKEVGFLEQDMRIFESLKARRNEKNDEIKR